MKNARPPMPRIAPSNRDLLKPSQYRSFATAELSMEEVEAIAKTRMHPRHNKLNELLDGKMAEDGDTRATSAAVIPAPRVPEGYSRE